MSITKKDLEAAAEKGAEKALKKVGLSDEYAGEDIRNLRALLKAIRVARATAWQTSIRVLTTAALVALLAGAAVKIKMLGG